jgi:hypothetical protein
MPHYAAACHTFAAIFAVMMYKTTYSSVATVAEIVNHKTN